MHTHRVKDPLPPARNCTHFGDTPLPQAACALYVWPLTEVESALDAVHVASHVGKALVHIMAVLQSREAMLERT